MRMRAVLTTVIAAGLVLAPVFAGAAGAAQMAVSAPSLQAIGVVRTGPAMLSRAMPVVGTTPSFQVGRVLTGGLAPVNPTAGATMVAPPVWLPNATFFGSVSRPSGQLAGAPIFRLPTAPLPRQTTLRFSQFAPVMRRALLPPAASTVSASALGTAVTPAPVTQATAVPTASETGELSSPLDEFPLPSDVTSVGALAAPLDEGPLPPTATTSLPPEEAPIALSLEEFIGLPMDMPIALPPGAVLSPFEPGAVSLPPTAVLSPSQVTLAPLPPGIVEGGLQMLP